MAELATLARPYAAAVFELAKEVGNFDEWEQGLDFLAATIEDPAIAAVLANPRIEKNTLTRILLDVCEGRLGDVGNNLIKLLIANHRVKVIPHLANQYKQLKAQYQQFVKVEIVSTYAVKPEQQMDIETVMKKRLGKSVDIQITVDESLLGGWLVRAGDQVIDLSIRGRLEQLATTLRR